MARRACTSWEATVTTPLRTLEETAATQEQALSRMVSALITRHKEVRAHVKGCARTLEEGHMENILSGVPSFVKVGHALLKATEPTDVADNRIWCDCSH